MNFLQDPAFCNGLRADIPHLNKVVFLAWRYRNTEDIIVLGQGIRELFSDGCE